MTSLVQSPARSRSLTCLEEVATSPADDPVVIRIRRAFGSLVACPQLGEHVSLRDPVLKKESLRAALTTNGTCPNSPHAFLGAPECKLAAVEGMSFFTLTVVMLDGVDFANILEDLLLVGSGP